MVGVVRVLSVAGLRFSVPGWAVFIPLLSFICITGHLSSEAEENVLQGSSEANIIRQTLGHSGAKMVPTGKLGFLKEIWALSTSVLG